MTSGLRIAPMSSEDMRRAVDWAADEGWNPGLEDAETFRAVDPQGFLMGWLGDEPVAAISVVRHSGDFGFLGFYLCRPEYRGQGHGLAVWQAGMAHLGDRVVGLDGVPAQQENYARSGFGFAHRTRRFVGSVAARAHAGFLLARAEDLPDLLAFDRRVSGAERTVYLTHWFQQTDTRRTMIARRDGRIVAAGTIRACREEHKIGPLFAPDAELALALIETLAAAAEADRIAIDVPDPNEAAVALVEGLGLTSPFACARMYRGPAPQREMATIFGETTFELG